MAKLPTCKLTPLPSTITLAIGGEAERLGLETPPDRIDGRTIQGEHGNLCLWLNVGVTAAPWPIVAGVIAHEAVHLVDYAFEYVGEEHRTDEIRSYYVEHITTWAATEVEKRRD
ncbi:MULTISPECIES: hypothetical protein [unclassified Luteococcus]|uniref:hypothetical protein n=1 Tax=unclassified Luteococcus TaxID=2639923 RepID=UPI00313BEA2C